MKTKSNSNKRSQCHHSIFFFFWLYFFKCRLKKKLFFFAHTLLMNQYWDSRDVVRYTAAYLTVRDTAALSRTNKHLRAALDRDWRVRHLWPKSHEISNCLLDSGLHFSQINQVYRILFPVSAVPLSTYRKVLLLLRSGIPPAYMYFFYHFLFRRTPLWKLQSRTLLDIVNKVLSPQCVPSRFGTIHPFDTYTSFKQHMNKEWTKKSLRHLHFIPKLCSIEEEEALQCIQRLLATRTVHDLADAVQVWPWRIDTRQANYLETLLGEYRLSSLELGFISRFFEPPGDTVPLLLEMLARGVTARDIGVEYAPEDFTRVLLLYRCGFSFNDFNSALLIQTRSVGDDEFFLCVQQFRKERGRKRSRENMENK
jgi:hypothetical protein